MRGTYLVALAAAAALLTAAPARAADKDAIDAAVRKGVKCLQTQPATFDASSGGQIGLTALIALTLLECDVPPDDAGIQRAVAAVRRDSLLTDKTYSIALAILLLDRLGEPVDVALIESLTVRLLAGQSLRGTWSYNCPRVSEGEQRRLSSLLEQRGERGPDKGAAKPEPGKRKFEDLPREIQGQLESVRRQRASGRQPEVMMAGDNSNTQFAILGLWVARRHGLPVEEALEATARHFRGTVNVDGGWGYVGGGAGGGRPGLGMGGVDNGSGSSPSMTCAGLLGLAFAYGASESALHTGGGAKEPGKPGAGGRPQTDPGKDNAVHGGFRLLGGWVDAMAYAKGRAPLINHASARFYYFVWSLERVAVAYNVEKIGKADWYHWGAGILLANQGPDGGWNNGSFAGGPDTCFALLFLRRANLAKDLTRSLAAQMKGGLQATLKGGSGELTRGRKPFFDGPAAEGPHDKADDDEAAKLGEQLPRAAGAKRDRLIEQLRDGKGGEYTQALASAITRLEGDSLKKAREALAERMSRMNSETLSAKLDDDAAEVRRAAALAVAMKEDKAHALKLIDMLDDREATVSRAAHAALVSLSGDKDFGPPKGAAREARQKAMTAWRDFWLKQLREK